MATLLVVEDDQSLLELLIGVLEDEGHTVVTAKNGLSALGMVLGVQPDLIITDVMMAGIDGVEFCKRIQANPQTASFPIVLCSAAKEETVKDRCQYAAFIAKPFDLDHLLGVVAAFTRSPA